VVPLRVLELAPEPLRERQQIEHVGGGIAHLLLRERPARPVGALLVLRQIHVEVARRYPGQAYRRIAEQLRRDHRVEQIRELEPAVALEHEDVVLGGVEDLADLRRREHGPEWRELGGAAERDRIDQVDLPARADLDQAGLVEVVVEAVGLGVDGDHLLAEQVVRERIEIRSGLDQFVVRHSFPQSHPPIGTRIVVSATRGTGGRQTDIP
jgi:hypothetical protein